MGSGSWSTASYASYSVDNNLANSNVNTAFKSRSINHVNTIKSLNIDARTYNKDIDAKMLNVGVRECRDSEEHPNTTPIIVAFDVTGSMGHIPHKMVTELLPKLMNQLKEIGVPDPELLFMGIGDHLYDRAPIQITQFESDTEKICSSLQSLYLEGGGGGTRVESYLLAWIAAGYHTETDSWYNRHKKGFLFTIGDEGNATEVSSDALVRCMGYESGCKPITDTEAYNKACEQYHVFHIHVNDGYNRFNSDWNEKLGDHVLRCDSSEINMVIGDTIHKYLNKESSDSLESNSDNNEYKY